MTLDLARPVRNLEVITHEGLSWAYVERPASAELDYIARTYGFDAGDLAAQPTPGRRSAVTCRDSYIVVDVGFPVLAERQAAVAVRWARFLVSPLVVATLNGGDLRPLARVFREGVADAGARAGLFGGSTGHLLCRLIAAQVEQLVTVRDGFAEDGRNLDSAVFEGPTRETARQLSALQHDIITLRSVVRGIGSVVTGLQRAVYPFMGESLGPGWAEITARLGEIGDDLEMQRDDAQRLVQTSNSLAAIRTFEGLRALTLVVAVAAPLLVVSGLFAMNLPTMPLAGQTYAFEAALGLMAVVVLLVLWALRRRGSI